ncbi:MAG: hypothetical protein KA004_06635 [Verrucomicrobiales bacterium]|nr:hypothetical protein [Verrucomicrobiales bacterium]
MLPLLFTRQFILETKQAKARRKPKSMILADATQTLYTVERLKTRAVPHPRGILRFEFECLLPCPTQKILFGLLSTSGLGVSSLSPGLVVSLHPDAGIITDLANDSGVVGHLESAPLTTTLGVSIAVELEFFRQVCLPKLIVGDETFLHPALYLYDAGELSAVVGQAVVPRGGMTMRRWSLTAKDIAEQEEETALPA